MPVTKLQGVSLPFRVQSLEEDPELIGIVGERSANGSLIESVAVEKRVWAGEMPAKKGRDARAYAKLIRGAGHSWRIDDANVRSYTSIAPKSGVINYTAAAGKHGGGKITVASGASLTFGLGGRMGTWQPSHGWTIIGWFTSTGTWAHRVITYDGVVVHNTDPGGGKQWSDGVESADTGHLYLSMDAAGDFAIHGLNPGAAMQCSSFIILPYKIPDSWGPELYTRHNAAAFPHLPLVELQGQWLDLETTATVRGRARFRHAGHRDRDGTWNPAARRLSFELIES